MALSAERNILKGVCPCGTHLHEQEGWWVKKIRQLRCEPCLQKDNDRHAAFESKQRLPAGAPPGREYNRVRIFWNEKGKRAIANTFKASRAMADSFRETCLSAGLTYSSDFGYYGSISLIPELVRLLEIQKFQIDVSHNLADELLKTAGDLRGKAASANMRTFTSNRRKKILDYQREDIQWLAPKRVALVAHDGGLGKTRIVCEAAPLEPRMLVVCPKGMRGAYVRGVPRGGWIDELKLWRPDIKKLTILESKKDFRWPEPGEAVILNYEGMPPTPEEIGKRRKKLFEKTKKANGTWEEPDFGKPAPAPPDGVLLIADEAHYLATANSARTQRFERLSRMVRSTANGRVWGMSATPLKNDPEELWIVLNVLGCDKIAFGSRNNFAALHNAKLEPIPGGRQRWVMGLARPEVADCLRRVMIRRRKRDVLKDLPPLTMRRMVVEVDSAALKACDAAVQAIEAAGLDIKTAMETLDETRNGPIDFKVIAKALKALSRVKTPIAMELAEGYERNGTPCVFFARHLDPIQAFSTRPNWAVISGQTTGLVDKKGKLVPHQSVEVVAKFQGGDVDHACVMMQVSGVGITLTRASDAVLIEKAWNPAANAQAIWRIERIGQKNPMNVIDLVANHPLDLHMSEVNEAKIEHYMASVDAASVDADGMPVLDPGAVFERAAEYREQAVQR